MKRSITMLALLPLVALALIAVVFMKPFSAGAAPAARVQAHQHIFGTKQSMHASRTSPGNNLVYHGGPVMGGTANVYAIFWEPKGSFVSATYNSLILRYFGDVGGSSLYHNNTQYTDSHNNIPSNASLAGSWVDTTRYPSRTLSDFNIQIEVMRAQRTNGWTSSIDNVFFVFTAKGENICINGSTCSFTTFCAYHSYFGSDTLYAAMPYTGTNLRACGVTHSPNNDFDADSTINVASHEQMEAATDPLINAWYDAGGNEIGDKCAWMFGPLNQQGGDVLWGSDAYEVQEEWDNTASGCVLSGP